MTAVESLLQRIRNPDLAPHTILPNAQMTVRSSRKVTRPT